MNTITIHVKVLYKNISHQNHKLRQSISQVKKNYQKLIMIIPKSKKSSSKCHILSPSVGDKLTEVQSWKSNSLLQVGQISHLSMGEVTYS